MENYFRLPMHPKGLYTFKKHDGRNTLVRIQTLSKMVTNSTYI